MRPYRVELLPGAERDLWNIEDYIGSRNPKACRELLAALFGAINMIALFPELGVKTKFMRGARNHVARGYHIFYRLDPESETVVILRIFDGRRDLGDLT